MQDPKFDNIFKRLEALEARIKALEAAVFKATDPETPTPSQEDTNGRKKK
jgi:uncharacterized protein YdcH (DUF465 family)